MVSYHVFGQIIYISENKHGHNVYILCLEDNNHIHKGSEIRNNLIADWEYQLYKTYFIQVLQPLVVCGLGSFIGVRHHKSCYVTMSTYSITLYIKTYVFHYYIVMFIEALDILNKIIVHAGYGIDLNFYLHFLKYQSKTCAMYNVVINVIK